MRQRRAITEACGVYTEAAHRQAETGNRDGGENKGMRAGSVVYSQDQGIFECRLDTVILPLSEYFCNISVDVAENQDGAGIQG